MDGRNQDRLEFHVPPRECERSTQSIFTSFSVVGGSYAGVSPPM